MDSHDNDYAAHFADILLANFITLKLAGFIDWSWWIVFSPLWISFIVYLVLMLLIKVIK